MNYIEEVRAVIGKNKGYLLNGGIERLVEQMEIRQRIALDKTITKLTKLKRITAYKTYELDPESLDGTVMAPLWSLALKHTIHLINGILKFDKVSKEYTDSYNVITYHRTVDDFKALMQIRKDGFELRITNGDTIIFDRVVGGRQIRHERNWVRTMDAVNKLDLGIMKKRYGLASDIFEAEYKVTESNIEAIKDKIRQAFVDNGLMTRKAAGEGFTVGNASISKRTTYRDVLMIRQMCHGETVWEYKEAIRIANEVLKSEGYTKKYER